MERVWAQYGRKARIPAYIKEELRLAGFKIRSKRTWLNRTQISECCENALYKIPKKNFVDVWLEFFERNEVV